MFNDIRKLVSVLFFVSALFGQSRDAHAQCCPNSGLPSFGTSSSTGNVFQIDSTAGNAIYGFNSASGDGVYGGSNGANGVEGSTGNSGASGVYGHNSAAGGYGVAARMTATNNTGYALYSDNSASAGHGWAGVFSGNVYVSGTLQCGSSPCGSDIRLKKNVAPVSGALGKLLQLKGVAYEWIDPSQHENHTGRQVGVIAQDVQQVFPQWVHEDLQTHMLVVQPDERTALALTVEGMRELKTQNDELRERVQAVERSRRPMVSGLAQGGLWIGMLGFAGTVAWARRKR